jgi:hypothetical protein
MYFFTRTKRISERAWPWLRSRRRRSRFRGARGCRCGCRFRSGGSWTRRRRFGSSFSLLLARREERGTGQDADVFFHSDSWKRDIALID